MNNFITILVTKPSLICFPVHLAGQFSDIIIEDFSSEDEQFIPKLDRPMTLFSTDSERYFGAYIAGKGRVKVATKLVGLLSDLIIQDDSVSELIQNSYITLYEYS